MPKDYTLDWHVSAMEKANYIYDRPLAVRLKLVLQTTHGQGKASCSLQSARIIAVHELAVHALCTLPLPPQLPGASREQGFLALAGQRRLLGRTLGRPAPTSSPHLSPVLPKHCHQHPGRLITQSLMMRHPGGVAIGSVGAQPVRNTRHPVSACLPCLDLPCPPVLPKPPRHPSPRPHSIVVRR
jgi:hypothetical protein